MKTSFVVHKYRKWGIFPRYRIVVNAEFSADTIVEEISDLTPKQYEDLRYTFALFEIQSIWHTP